MANDLRLQVLLQALDKASGPLRNIDNASRNVTKAIRTTRDSLREMELEQQNLKRSLDAGKMSALEYGRANTLLQGRIDQTTNSLEIQQRAARNLGLRTRELANIERSRAEIGGKLLRTVAGVAAASYALSRGLGGGFEFSRQMQLIGNTADLTGPQIEGLRGKIMLASKATGQYASDIQGGIGLLVAAGDSVDLASRKIDTIGKVATGAGADMLDVANAAFTIGDSFGVVPEKLTKAFDILSQAGKDGKFELRDMAKSIPAIGASFGSLKMQGNEALATMGAGLQIAFKGAGNADEAANNMRNYLNKVLSPDTLKKAQANFGIDMYKIVTDAQKSGGNPFEASIEAIIKATGGDQKKLGEFFQDQQVQAFLRPMIQHWEKYKEIKDDSLSANGVVERDFAKMMEQAAQKVKNMNIAAKGLALAFSKSLEPGIGKAAAAIGPLIDRVTAFVDAHPKLVSSIASIVTSLVAMRIALLGIRYGWTFVGGSLAQRSIASLRKAMAAQAAARLGAGAAPAAAGGGLSMLSGIGAAISAIGLPVIALGVAIAAVGFLVWKYWGPIKAWFVGIGKGISEAMKPVLADLGPLKPLFDGIVAALKSLFTPFKATKDELAGATANGVTLGKAMGWVLGTMVTAVKYVAIAFQATGEAIGTSVAWIVVTGGKVIDWFSNTWAALKEVIKLPFVMAFEWITEKLDFFMAKWRALKASLGMQSDPVAMAGVQWNTGGGDSPAAPAGFFVDNSKPLKAGGGTSVINNHYPIQVTAAPGREVDAAKAVSAELDRRDRAKAAAVRSRLGDTE
jgi:TP901 family phage tail tape measure protein